MELRVGKLFMHRHEGLSICAGIWKSGYTAYRLEFEKEPVWYWNNDNWDNEKEYKKGDWLPFTQDCEKAYEGCDCFYNDSGAIVFGRLIEDHGDIIGLSTSTDYLAYIPRKACRRLEWMENRKPSLRVVA